ncbi:MAG: NUDIX hydrolase [Ketobacter sp.]|nr:NUDIX hydrolase [Ketobacter sp.]
MNEKEYLEAYDVKSFETPLLSVDSVLFTYHQQTLQVLLVKRSNHPDQGKWGVPGGFVDLKVDACLEDAVIRKLSEKTGVAPPYVEQLASIGNNQRDKRGWSVTICYTALIAHQECEARISDVSDAQWIELTQLDKIDLAFDHDMLIESGRKRLKQKALYSIIPAYALPEQFTLSELQHLHEVLIGKSIQKRSFRRRIELADLLIDTGEKRSERGRPASLYSIKPTSAGFTFIRNLED